MPPSYGSRRTAVCFPNESPTMIRMIIKIRTVRVPFDSCKSAISVGGFHPKSPGSQLHRTRRSRVELYDRTVRFFVNRRRLCTTRYGLRSLKYFPKTIRLPAETRPAFSRKIYHLVVNTRVEKRVTVVFYSSPGFDTFTPDFGQDPRRPSFESARKRRRPDVGLGRTRGERSED